MSKDDFDIITALGEGAYGRVMLCRKKTGSSKLFALKAIRKKQLAGHEGEHARVRAMEERQIMERMVHEGVPFVVNLHYAFQSQAHIYFVLDFCQGGELFFHLRQHGVFSPVWARFYLAQIVLGKASATLSRAFAPQQSRSFADDSRCICVLHCSPASNA